MKKLLINLVLALSLPQASFANCRDDSIAYEGAKTLVELAKDLVTGVPELKADTPFIAAEAQHAGDGVWFMMVTFDSSKIVSGLYKCDETTEVVSPLTVGWSIEGQTGVRPRP